MHSSPYLAEAIELLDSVKGKPQTLRERKRLSIELAALMLHEASRNMTSQERAIQEQLSKMMTDPVGKAFTMAMTDECFRSSSHRRIADQMIYLLQVMGIPHYLDWIKKSQLYLFRSLGVSLSQFLVPFATHALRKETSKVILPGEKEPLSKHLQERKKEGIRLNLNHLGEAILSESEAKKRLQVYLDDLKDPEIDYVSVKISTVFSQINLLAFDETVDAIVERMKQLYRAAMKYPVSSPTGETRSKFVNLDMEEYRDLHLTLAAFKKVLEDSEFHYYSAGVVLQAYLPDSHEIQKELTEWAKRRVKQGGAPIKVRIVKGANLAMEQFEASLRGWPQAPYTSKSEVDSNYKRMVLYGCIPENARAVHLGIASHNLFDIAFSMLLRLENGVESYVSFEMLEGIASHVRRVVQTLTQDMLLYCPVATKEEFQHAIAYLIRRLDENSGAENFLRYLFGLKVGSDHWDAQTALFSESCEEIETAPLGPRRTQDRLTHPPAPTYATRLFENDPDTDFALPHNQRWAKEIARYWESHRPKPLPLVIAGKELFANEEGVGTNPSKGGEPLFRYAKAKKEEIDAALECAKAHEKEWASTPLKHRIHLLTKAAQKMREQRGDLIGAMMLDGGKTIPEADIEVSEAIDFAEYYCRRMEKITAMKDLQWQPKGTILVTPPWNFPCSIPAGGISAALITGNCVLFKPASDTVLIGWHLARLFWEAGIPKEILQFIPCSGEEVGESLIGDSRINCVVLTGGTATAKRFLEMRPNLDLAAETGGKNALIITALADRDLAVKDLIQSAFGHSGQKCSAASLAILEAEVYDDPQFLHHLKEAVASLKVGPPWDLAAKVNPLIHEPRDVLKRGLTTLEPGEEWLLEPKKDLQNPCLWSPGIKLVPPGGFTHMTELFGPVLALIRADNLHHAIELANAVPYGLTSGIHSLDEREQLHWLQEIEAGNLYINRTITGAIVRRQPFGGTKASSFGNGSKAGGPNYLREFMHATQVGLPQEKHPVNEAVNNLTLFLEKLELSAEQLGLWTASVANYAYWWKRLRQERDPSKVVGQDNFFRYVPRKGVVLRLSAHSNPLDTLRSCAAALTCGASLTISYDATPKTFNWQELSTLLPSLQESDEQFYDRLEGGTIQRIRLLEPAPLALQTTAAPRGILTIDDPVLANGRFELLHYLREVSISIDYHRYGNLGLREGELRKPIL